MREKRACKVSVIIPTYNRAEMVGEAVQSALNQSYPHVEVIVVDDGSTDGTEELVRREFGDRIRYLYQENSGRSRARNRGIEAATGDAFIFLDSDDWLLPNAAEDGVAFLQAHPDVEVAYGDGYYTDATGKRLSRLSDERPAVPRGRLLAVMVLHNLPIAPHAAIVRRRALDRLGGPPWFDESLRGAEDADFWLRLAAAGAPFAEHEAIVCLYRLHDENASSPRHPLWSRRWRSLQRFKRKTYLSPFFPTLPLKTRTEFIRQLLVIFFAGQPEEQEAIIAAEPFQALPKEAQAELLRRAGLEAILHGQVEVGQRWLRRSCELSSQPRYCWTSKLAFGRGALLRSFVPFYRRLRGWHEIDWEARRRGTEQ